MVAEDRAGLVARLEVCQHALVDAAEELGHLARKLAVHLACVVDLLEVLTLGAAHLREGCLAHLDAIAPEAVLHHVRDEGAERPGVVGAAQPVVERVRAHEAGEDGVLAVLAHVGNDVRDAHDTALERHGAQVPDGHVSLVPAAAHDAAELVEAGEAACLEHLPFAFAVVADHAVERLQGEVAAVEHVEHAYALHVVEEPAARALVEHVVQEALAGVAEGRVADVVAKGDGLDEVEVEPERQTDVPRHATHELHVEAAARDVVVGAQGEYLRLAGEAVVGRQVDDLLGVTHEGRAPGGVAVTLSVEPADGSGVGRGIGAEVPVGALVQHGGGHLRRETLAKLGRAAVDLV